MENGHGWAFAGLWLIIFTATSLWRVAGVVLSRFVKLSAEDMQRLSELAGAALMAQMGSLIWRPMGSLVNLPLELRLCIVGLAVFGWFASGRSVLFGLVMGVGGILVAGG